VETINERGGATTTKIAAALTPSDNRRVSMESRLGDDLALPAYTVDQEELYLSKNMPWLKVLTLIL